MRRYIPDFIVRVDDGHGEDDLLNVVVEIKGYRGEDAKDKKLTMDTYWVPGVNHLETYGRWAFRELTQLYLMEEEFEQAFNELIDEAAGSAGQDRDMKTTADQPLTRDEALRILRENKAELAERYGVLEVALFGSTVRNEARPDSDVDILLWYDELPDWITYFSVHPFLEELFGRSVDVCTAKELREKFRTRVEAEAVYV